MPFLAELENIARDPHAYARRWKEEHGGRVLGYFCTYVPEEVLYAAGILPVRILGGLTPQDITEPYIYAMYCPWCRDCLAQGLLGRYDYLDGVVSAKSCFHMQQAFDTWVEELPTPFSHFIGMPINPDAEPARDYLLKELEAFKRALEEWLGEGISGERLSRAIEVYNRNRRLLYRLYELRRRRPPLLSGREALSVLLSTMVMDKAESNRCLEGLLRELEQRPAAPSGVRLMLAGGENTDPGLLEVIEGAGAVVVVEEMCTGSRYFWEEVPEDEDPLAALAERLIRRPPCPNKDILRRRRFEHILNLAREYEVDGVVLVHQKFCDPHEFDTPPLQKFLREQGFPCLFLELDTLLPRESIRTRVEAFLETMLLE